MVVGRVSLVVASVMRAPLGSIDGGVAILGNPILERFVFRLFHNFEISPALPRI